MPNWCLNTLTVVGNDADLDLLLTTDRDPAPQTPGTGTGEPRPFSLERLLPTPAALLESGAWYEWRMEHWGTKWDLEDARVERAPGRVTVVSLSAWGPPLVAFQALSARHPALRFAVSYEEPLVELSGVAAFSAGACLYDR